MSTKREFNAVGVIAAREIVRFFKDWKSSLVFSFMFPVLFLGILGGSIAQNLSSGLGYNYLQFALIGMVTNTLVMNTMISVTSLVEDRENDFTQEIFVAPVSRYSIIIGKILGGTLTSILQLFAFVIVALVMGISVGLPTIGWILLLAPIICISGGALGSLIASIFSSSPKTADRGVIMIAFAQMFLSGAIIPINNSTGVLSVLAHA
ncbi:MAG TPA: ABC transporter permease, partial [Verrucomicrobiae bacterium]|nr:ABC transporter permease [Verrucomicrobiae bacterium]